MTLNNIWLKVARIFRKLKRRIEMGIPFSLARTNKANEQEYIREYATATGVVSDIHVDDLIFRFLVENPGLRSSLIVGSEWCRAVTSCAAYKK